MNFQSEYLDTPKQTAQNILTRIGTKNEKLWMDDCKQMAYIMIDQILFELIGAGQRLRYNYYLEVKKIIKNDF